MSPPRILILGAGPAGLGAAFWAARRGFAPLLVEARDSVGGNAGSFTFGGIPVDYGSHRLHPATHPVILAELRELLGGELLERPRHGRILLGGRWIHFPLRPLDLALGAPPSFLLGATKDVFLRLARRGGTLGGAGARDGEESFASVLHRGLGPTICEEFYFPYARKIWGLEPEEISPLQARKRVSAGSLTKLLSRLLPGGSSGGGGSGRGVFYYPREGYGRISEALRDGALAAGATLQLETRAVRIQQGAQGGGETELEVGGPEGAARETVGWDHLWSTIPLGVLARSFDPPPPSAVLDAVGGIEHRAMILVYLLLGTGRFTEFDAHYFPSPEVPFTRLSEPKNYGAREEPSGRTVLCAEIPCSRDDPLWSRSDRELGEQVLEGLARAGLPVRSPVLEVGVRRLPTAYPLFRKGYEKAFGIVDDWTSRLPGVLTFGRQGLHTHDNTHHALEMARAAVACLKSDGSFDEGRWKEHRAAFQEHVVED